MNTIKKGTIKFCIKVTSTALKGAASRAEQNMFLFNVTRDSKFLERALKTSERARSYEKTLSSLKSKLK